MILREKIILVIVSIIILMISFEYFTTINFDINKDIILETQDIEVVNKNQNFIKENQSFNFLKKSWGKDIFYNRSYVYKSWFILTGITQFDDGNKALINGKIIHEKDKIKGFTVTQIANNYVQLKKNKHIVTLKIKE
tara:strand:- start:461 stop:871 length:411 start_codon:yes stop_codon:yes gene_type:complete